MTQRSRRSESNRKHVRLGARHARCSGAARHALNGVSPVVRQDLPTASRVGGLGMHSVKYKIYDSPAAQAIDVNQESQRPAAAAGKVSPQISRRAGGPWIDPMAPTAGEAGRA